MMNLGTSNALVALAESCLLHGWKVCLHLLFRTIDMLFFMKWEWPFKKKFLGKMMLYFFRIGTFSLHCFIFFLRKPHCDSLFHCFVPTVNQTVRLRAETWRVQSLSTTFCYILLILKPTASSGSSQNDPQVWSFDRRTQKLTESHSTHRRIYYRERRQFRASKRKRHRG